MRNKVYHCSLTDTSFHVLQRGQQEEVECKFCEFFNENSSTIYLVNTDNRHSILQQTLNFQKIIFLQKIWYFYQNNIHFSCRSNSVVSWWSWEFVVTPWWYVWLLCMAASWLRWCAFDKNNEIKQAWAGLILEQTIIFGSFLGEHQMSAQSSILSLSASSSTIEILRVKVSCHWSAVIHFLMFLGWHFCVVTIEAYKQLCHCYLYSGFTVKPV